MNNATDTRAGRAEDVVLVLILLTVVIFAGAASFTHVKDWTLANSPHGTGPWFGWANAVISELVPIAALLTIRRRRRTGAPIGYPITLLILAASLSLAAQLAVATPSPSGWLLSAVPALAFMALAKLVLTPTTTPASRTETNPAGIDHPAVAPAVNQPSAGDTPTPATAPEPIRLQAPAHLIPAARFAVTNHHATTGRLITADELAARISVPPAVASALLADISATAPAALNGAAVHGGDAR